MIVGTERISPEQKQLLDLAKRSTSASDLHDIFLRVFRDDDLNEEREEIHPAWGTIFLSKAHLLRDHVSTEAMKQLTEFFDRVGPVDTSITAISPETVRIAFLLGAGASKPAPSNIPTVRELLPHLLDRARRLQRDDVMRLADFCDNRGIDNIEDLLTAAQLATFSSKNQQVFRLMSYLLFRREEEASTEESWRRSSERTRHYGPRIDAADVSSVAFLQDTLQTLFGLLANIMLPASPNKAHESIAQYAANHLDTRIVTTNYDCCMDLALANTTKPFEYRIGFKGNPAPQASHSDTTLVKLHGSLNWFYCETCQEVQLVELRSMVQQYEEDKSPYPVIGICKACGGQRRGLLVPPLAIKFDVAPQLTSLLEEAKNAFELAEIITVVGFSFAEADLYISRMLLKSMQTKLTQKIIIIDPSGDVCERVRRKFKTSIRGFDISRIIRCLGNCSEMLPKFLSGGLKKDISQDGPTDQKKREEARP
ncbi:MAG: SIR2 family protein [Phycisphaerae bacterium]|jgi:NAD-dependent SIR2 family protein deacetylase